VQGGAFKYKERKNLGVLLDGYVLKANFLKQL
jgi:hypothetical protein